MNQLINLIWASSMIVGVGIFLAGLSLLLQREDEEDKGFKSQVYGYTFTIGGALLTLIAVVELFFLKWYFSTILSINFS